MTDTGSRRLTDAVSIRDVRYGAGLLAVIVGGMHLLHPDLGLSRLLVYLEVGTLFDPRPAAFVASSVLFVCGPILVRRGRFVRSAYAAGILLVLIHLLGYAAWHTVLDHGAFWPHLHGHAHHDVGALETIWIHLASDRVALVTKLHELALLVALVVLFGKDTSR